MLKGSCLCGSVAFEVDGDRKRFFHCHCSRCRKATGTGHASNVIVIKPDHAKFTKGADMLTRYDVPGAGRFANTFCNRCGARMPNFASDNSLAVVPAGALDADPSLRPEARIFLGSKAEWSCDETSVPGFDEYPVK